MTQEELQALLEEWQERLGLENWDIRAKLTDCAELEPEIKGDVHMCVASSEAKIRVLAPEWWTGEFEHDPEKTLVHELLHCLWMQFENYKEDSLEYRMTHQVVDRLAKVLVKLKRRGEAECQPVQ
jgi:hypothetical protein